MKEAFLYDGSDGEVYHCLFTGMDCAGHSQWLNLTRDCYPVSLFNECVSMDDLKVLSADGKPVPSKYVAEVLSLKLSAYSKDLNEKMEYAINHMKEIGVDWTKDAIVLEFGIYGYEDGTYALLVYNPGTQYELFNNLNGFNSLDKVLKSIWTYLTILELTAKIPVNLKFIRIDNKLKGKIDESKLAEFDNVTYTNL